MGAEIFFNEARDLARATQRHVQSTLGQGDLTASAFDRAIAAIGDAGPGVVRQLTRIRDDYTVSLTRGCTTADALAIALQENVNLYEDYDQSAASIFNPLAQGPPLAPIPPQGAGG